MDQTAIPPTPDPNAPNRPVNDVEDNKDIAALSYAWMLSIFIYFWKKDSPFVRFHAKQGIVLFILSILVWLIPFVGHILELIVLALCVLGFLSAAQGQWKDLPIISDIARGNWSHVRQSWRDIVSGVAKMWQHVHDSTKKEKKADQENPSAASTSAIQPSPTPTAPDQTPPPAPSSDLPPNTPPSV